MIYIMMTDIQVQIIRQLNSQYQHTGFKFQLFETDAIKVFNDDGTESIFRIVDSDVKEEKTTVGLVPTDTNVK